MSSTAHREIPYPDPSLTDGAIVLRKLIAEDAPQLAALYQDVPRHYVERAVTTEREAIAQIARVEADRLAGQLRMAIADARDGRLLGTGALYRIGEDGLVGEIGVIVASSARKARAAITAGRLMLPWAFGELGLRRLQARCVPENDASRILIERLGFQLEGRLRSYCPQSDDLLFSLLPGDCEA